MLDTIQPAIAHPTIQPLVFENINSALKASPTFFNSSVQPHPDAATPFYLPSKPTLSHPIYALCREIESLEGSGTDILHLETLLLRRMHENQQAKYIEFLKKVEEGSKLHKEQDWWSGLKQILSLLINAVTSIFGFVLVANGAPLIGGLSIALGVLSITNYILEQTGTWDKWEQNLTFTKDQIELRKQLALFIPAILGTAVSVFSIWGGQIDLAKQGALVIKTLFDLLKAGSSLKEGALSYDASQLRSLETAIQHEIEAIDLKQEELLHQIETLMKDLKNIRYDAAKTIELASAVTDACQLKG